MNKQQFETIVTEKVKAAMNGLLVAPISIERGNLLINPILAANENNDEWNEDFAEFYADHFTSDSVLKNCDIRDGVIYPSIMDITDEELMEVINPAVESFNRMDAAERNVAVCSITVIRRIMAEQLA